jgi:hypothetical protein
MAGAGSCRLRYIGIPVHGHLCLAFCRHIDWLANAKTTGVVVEAVDEAPPRHDGSSPTARPTGAVAQDGLAAGVSQGVRQVAGEAQAAAAASKLVLWRRRILYGEGALDASQSPPLDGKTEGPSLGGQGVAGAQLPVVASSRNAQDSNDEAAGAEAARGACCTRAAKLARWRRHRRGHDAPGAPHAPLIDSEIEDHTAVIERRQGAGGHGDGVAANSGGQEAHAPLRRSVLRHALPDLKSFGWGVNLEPGNRMLFVLRVFVRLPATYSQGAEGAGQGTGMSGASSPAIASSQVVEVFADIH